MSSTTIAASLGATLAALALGPLNAVIRQPDTGQWSSSLDVLERGSEVWAPVGSTLGEPGKAGCDITVRWQTSAADIYLYKSKVRVRGTFWTRLVGTGAFSWGQISPPAPLIHPYSSNPKESLFHFSHELHQSCSKYRRYRFKIVGRTATNGSTRFEGVERELYYPSSSSWTRTTNLDLGYLDLCLADGSRCSKPYYPGGNRTPYPK